MTSKRVVTTLLTLVLVVVLAACGDDEQENSSSGDSASSEQGGKAPDANLPPVKLGSIVNLNNPTNTNPDAAATLKAIERGWNSRGGLHGHEVEISICPSDAVANTDVACARKLIDEGVVAIVGAGHFGDYLTAPIFEKAQVPVLGTLAYSPVAAQSKSWYVLGESFTNHQIVNAISAHADKRISQVRLDAPVGAAWYEIIKPQVDEIGGEMLGATAIPGDETDWATVAAAATKDDPDVLHFILQDFQTEPLITQLEGQGFDGLYLPSQLTQTDMEKLPPSALGKIISASAFPDWSDSNPLVQQLRADMQAEFDGGNEDAALEEASDVFVNNAYYAMHALDQVTQDMKEITGPSIIDALESAQDIDFQDAIPAWTPSDEGPPGEWTRRVTNRSRLIFTFSEDLGRVPVVDGFVTSEEALAGDYELTPEGKEMLGVE